MEVEVVADKKILVPGNKPGSLLAQHMAGDLAHVEQAGKHIVLVGRAKLGGLQTRQPAGSGSSQLGEGGHDLAGAGMSFQDPVHFPVDATVDGMNQTVAAAIAGMLQEGGCENPLPARCEDQLHGVVHATGHDRLQGAPSARRRKM